MMADIHWLNPVDGNFDIKSDWSGGVVPGHGDTAILDASGGTPYTVTLTGNRAKSLHSLETSSTATLDIVGMPLPVVKSVDNGGTIIIEQSGQLIVGSKGGHTKNSGMISVDAGFLQLHNEVQNSGTISLIGHDSDMEPVGATLSGGGVIDLLSGRIDAGALTNVDNTIEGSGVIGGIEKIDRVTLVNEKGGVIDASKAKRVLEIDVRNQAITNAGLIEATNRGECVIDFAVDNTGTLLANGGTLTLDGAVTGSGSVDLAAGKVVIANANAAEAVAFTGKKAVLELDQSQTYAGQVSGLSRNGKAELDLRDVGFVSADEATFSGTSKSGVLTVTDGTHTAHITLKGNYTLDTFVASSDGQGGVAIVVASPQTPSVAHFAGAMATLTPLGAAIQAHADAASGVRPAMLVGPRPALA
jgi:hypothetical protein